MDPGISNQYAIYGGHYTVNSPTDMAPVGYASLGVARWGQLDMAGEVEEWNLDVYATYVDPCTDCAYLANTSSRVFGGGYNNAVLTSDLLPPIRGIGTPASRYNNVGFRCARTP
jgi:formylglycine-generating enzyme required for sulfatase activity